LSSVRAIPIRPTSSLLTILDLRAKADEESISKLKAKLVEASNVYSNDKETISWFVMQSVFDKQDFTIVERYEKESSQEYHLNNPYWKTFDPYVIPLLEKDMDMHRLEELEGSTM
jgi:quinol monooxygenase YgiN